MNNPCVIATPREDLLGDGRWTSVHRRYARLARNAEPDVVFVGDSIVLQLQFSTLWTEKINALRCLNFGIGGDRVENVLWRVQNGELSFHASPKALVLFVGTHNTDCTPHEVFEGILEIIKAVRERLGPEVDVVVPTLLPRGQHPNPYRERNDHVNLFLMDKFTEDGNADELTRRVHVVPIHEGVVRPDRTISHRLLHDYLHPTDEGYTKIFEPVYEKLVELVRK